MNFGPPQLRVRRPRVASSYLTTGLCIEDAKRERERVVLSSLVSAETRWQILSGSVEARAVKLFERGCRARGSICARRLIARFMGDDRARSSRRKPLPL